MDNYSRCATCLHYVPHKGFAMDMVTLSRKLGRDGQPLVVSYGYGACDRIVRNDSLLSHEPGYDCSSGCEITVTEDYGCVLHDAKE